MNRVLSFASACCAVLLGMAGLWACAKNSDGNSAASAEAGSPVEAGVDGAVACARHTILCGEGACVDPSSDPLNCGGCGAKCPSGQVCFQGNCAADCPWNAPIRCGGTCSALANDPSNCGHCGVKCEPGLVCGGGTCGCPVGRSGARGVHCGNACVDPDNDIAHCGGCGIACSSGLVCVAGKCTACGSGETICMAPAGYNTGAALAPSCVNTQTSPSNCGGCDNACDGGTVCVHGTCGCGPILSACGSACVNTRFDVNNCGGCGNACDGGHCVDGGCGP